jgi:hypothetical protein
MNPKGKRLKNGKWLIRWTIKKWLQIGYKYFDLLMGGVYKRLIVTLTIVILIYGSICVDTVVSDEMSSAIYLLFFKKAEA